MSSFATARNKLAYRQGQSNREQIKAFMLEHSRRHPLARPLSGKALKAHFPHLALSTIYWHVDAIREGADREAADTLESI